MEPLNFSKICISVKGGDRQVDLLATPSATVLDLRANVGSDAVWLKDSIDGLGDLLDEDVILREIPNLEGKILSIVSSCNRQERPGDPSQVKVIPKQTML